MLTEAQTFTTRTHLVATLTWTVCGKILWQRLAALIVILSVAKNLPCLRATEILRRPTLRVGARQDDAFRGCARNNCRTPWTLAAFCGTTFTISSTEETRLMILPELEAEMTPAVRAFVVLLLERIRQPMCLMTLGRNCRSASEEANPVSREPEDS